MLIRIKRLREMLSQSRSTEGTVFFTHSVRYDVAAYTDWKASSCMLCGDI